MITLGITGRSGCGKSTVTAVFSAHGVPLADADQISREMLLPSSPLLPVLARTLGVDLNTLLSFQEDLTDQEIGEFLNQLHQEARQRGCATAFAMAEDKLREFPGNDHLAYSIAGLLEGILTLYPGGDKAERTAWQEEIDELYDRCVRSAEPKIREWAAYTVAVRCIGRGELDRAEALLEGLSDTHRSKREALAILRRKQGRTEEAWVLLERELFDQAHGIQTTLLHMIDWALEEKDPSRAQALSDTAKNVGQVMDLSDYAVLSAPFQLAAAEQDGVSFAAAVQPQADGLEILSCAGDRWEEGLLAPGDLWSRSALYRHMATKEATGEAQSALIPCLLEQVEADPDCAFLRELPGYAELVKRYQT